MRDILKKILSDLYELDPRLKEDEENLIIIVKKIIVARPEVEINLAFARRLKAELLALAESGQTKSMKKSLFDLRILSGVLSGYAFVLAVALIAVGLFGPEIDRYSAGNDLITGKSNRIVRLDQGAFGKLNVQASETTLNSDATPAAKSLSRSLSQPVPSAEIAIGDDGAETSSGVGSSGNGGGALGKIAAGLDQAAPYIGYNYSYIYEGDDFSGLLSPAMTVYKKNPQTGRGEEIIGRIADMNIAGLDIAKFENLGLNYLNLVEDREFGYEISVSPIEGSFSINKNWQKWPEISSLCREENCFRENRIKASDLPSDDELLEIAANFIVEYEISTAGYGAAEVVRNSRETYEENGEKYFFTEDLQLVYPLLIDDREVYDEGGNKIGTFLNISARDKKVTGFYGQLENSYLASDYEAITEAEKIKESAQKGGTMFYGYQNADWETQEIKLGTPQLVLARTWKYDSEKNISEELFLPVLMFPIIEKPENSAIYQDVVVVHLIKEIVEERERETLGNPSVYPMLMKGAEEVPAVDTGEVNTVLTEEFPGE